MRLFLLGLFLLGGCASVSEEDGTAHVNALHGMEQEFDGMADAFSTITQRSMGDEAAKAAVLERIQTSRARFHGMATAAERAIAAQMSVDFEALYAQLRETYTTWRDK